ncbi:unnamed protein product [Adineta steineri]|uniref:Uncharacterized protein n=1 Tax=Adineta steineri TaxID=433720 RepID=A0A820CCR5_9BILA|nr:unnamed protein product [Adineta steineri]CAF4215425.1 unnamed protein product [Adineta steineri]
MAGSNRGRAPGDYINLPPNAAAHVDKYFEYCAIVGDNDDGGKLFSPEEYDAYKRRVLPTACIVFLLDHKINVFVDINFAEIPTARPILISCRCVSFEYVANASDRSDPNCRCKHSLHSYGTRPPLQLYWVEQRGRSTGYATPYKATDGLAGFSSLAEEYLRLDPSRLDDDFLNQPITAMDHPILRAHVFLDPNKDTKAQSQLRRPALYPYDTNAQLTTSIRNNKSPPRRITGDKK